MTWIGVALGGATGALFRFWLTQVIGERTTGTFPWATLLINLSGAFLLALLHPLLLSTVTAASVRLALTTGFLGAYTTFSTLTWEALVLLRENQWERAVLYVGVSTAAGLVAAWLGYTAAQWVSMRA